MKKTVVHTQLSYSQQPPLPFTKAQTKAKNKIPVSVTRHVPGCFALVLPLGNRNGDRGANKWWFLFAAPFGMHPTTLLLFILWPCFIQAQTLESLNPGPNKDTCKPISCTTSFKDYMGNERHFTRFWLYDSVGRVILDSINAPDSIWASPLYTEHYRYEGDSTIGTGKYTGTMAINATFNNNLPIVCILPNGAKYRALYNMDGRLEKVIIGRYGINQKGKKDVVYSTIDSISYFEGNIISYRFNGLVNYKVSFTYLKDSLYKKDYNPTDRILALIGRPDEEPGFLNVQVYSKELLNTEENGYIKTYTYQRDARGRVTDMNVAYNNGVKGVKSTYRHYSFKYQCP